jgi:hypothetical protein
LRPFLLDFLAKGQLVVQQPWRLGKADPFKVEVLRAVMIGRVQVGCGVYRQVARVLEDQGRPDLLGLLWCGRQEDEIDVLPTCWLAGGGCVCDAAYALSALLTVA